MPFVSWTGKSQQERNKTLFIRGAPDIEKTTSLYTGPSSAPDSEFTLFMAAPAGGNASLIIGRTDRDNEDISLYIFNRETVEINPVSTTSSVSLRLLGQPLEEKISQISLHIKAPGSSEKTGTLTFYASGASATSENPIAQEFSANLYIRNGDEYDSNVTLHIETDFNQGDTISLYVKSRDASGVIPMTIEGKTISDNSITLLVKPPVTSETTLFNRGYVE